jgi:methylated-DNA-[protein]-cysteine S-methyltransferase
VGLVRATHPSPLGPLTLDASDDGVRALWFDPATWREAAEVPAPVGAVVPASDHPVLRAVTRELDAWFAGELTRFDVPLDLRVSGFARDVLVAMIAIPHGQVRSYGALAAQLGRGAGSARAVGRACHRNPVPVVVPCHRVIASDGKLGGYGGGLELKARLLAMESSARPAALL